MSKGSRNRTADHKSYRESPVWKARKGWGDVKPSQQVHKAKKGKGSYSRSYEAEDN